MFKFGPWGLSLSLELFQGLFVPKLLLFICNEAKLLEYNEDGTLTVFWIFFCVALISKYVEPVIGGVSGFLYWYIGF